MSGGEMGTRGFLDAYDPATGERARAAAVRWRTVGRAIAEKAVADLRQGGLKLRTVTLTAKEKVLRLCAAGKIAIDVRGLEMLQAEPGESEDVAE